MIQVEGSVSQWLVTMATGNLSTWGMLAYDYDFDRRFDEQEDEFYEDLGYAAAAQLGLSVFLYHIGMSSLEFTLGRHFASQAVLSPVRTAVAPALPAVAAYYGSQAYIGGLEPYAPEEPTHQPSFWNSVAAGLAGTFGGVKY